MSDKSKNITYGMRTFYIIILTQVFSMIGSQISSLAIGIWVFAETGDATPLAMVAFFAVFPRIIMSSVAGVMADRFDRRYVMAFADIGQAAGTLLLLMSFMSGSFELWHLYAVSFFNALFGVFQGPAFASSITMLVDDENRPRANAIQQLTGPSAGIIAPVIAGIVYAAFGIVGAIIIDMVTFLMAVAVILSVKIPRPEITEEGQAMRGSVWSEALSGMKYVWQRKPLFLTMMYVSILNFLLAGLMVLSTPYLLARTQDEAVYGVLVSLINVGMLVGGIGMGIWGGMNKRMNNVFLGMAMVSIGLIFWGMAQTNIALAIVLGVVFIPIPMINASFMTILQQKVAPDVQGRVFAVVEQTAMLLTPISFLLVGPLADNVFEPLLQQPIWDSFAPFFGSTAGSGIGLMFSITGFSLFVVTIVASFIPTIRNAESLLPNHTPEPVAEDVPMTASDTDINEGAEVVPA